MADQVVVIVDGYLIALAVGLQEGLTENQARVMFSMTRAERRDLERELERELQEAAARARKRIKARIHTSKYYRNQEGDLVERQDQVPEWLNVELVKEEVEVRLKQLFQDWVQNNTWIYRIQSRDNIGWIRF